jgi:two-component system repressor protein LuxO
LTLFAKEEGKRFTDFAPEVEAVLQSYPWPGNVRQLQNVLRNVVVLKDAETVTLDMLPPPLDQVDASGGTAPAGKGREVGAGRQAAAQGHGMADGIRPLWQIEKDAIEDAIRLCQGNIPKAATHLGISASTIYRKRMSWQTGGEG